MKARSGLMDESDDEMTLYGSVVGGPLIMETHTGLGTLGHIQHTLDRLWARHPDIDGQVRAMVNLAVGEIGANIVEHTGAGTAITLVMRAEVADGEIRVHFIDAGTPAPVDLRTVAMPSELAERGRGLAIALQVLDQLSYRREDDGNHWTLVRRLAGEAAPDPG